MTTTARLQLDKGCKTGKPRSEAKSPHHQAAAPGPSLCLAVSRIPRDRPNYSLAGFLASEARIDLSKAVLGQNSVKKKQNKKMKFVHAATRSRLESPLQRNLEGPVPKRSESATTRALQGHAPSRYVCSLRQANGLALPLVQRPRRYVSCFSGNWPKWLDVSINRSAQSCHRSPTPCFGSEHGSHTGVCLFLEDPLKWLRFSLWLALKAPKFRKPPKQGYQL